MNKVNPLNFFDLISLSLSVILKPLTMSRAHVRTFVCCMSVCFTPDSLVPYVFFSLPLFLSGYICLSLYQSLSTNLSLDLGMVNYATKFFGLRLMILHSVFLIYVLKEKSNN